MEAKMKPDQTTEPEIPDTAESPEAIERVLKFSTSFKDKATPAGADRGPQPKRDLSSALDLVNEAFEAIRIAEERAAAAEEYHQQLIQHHKDQLKALDIRLAASEKRADTAEARAKDAEGWLAKFHDTIVDGFQRTFVTK